MQAGWAFERVCGASLRLRLGMAGSGGPALTRPAAPRPAPQAHYRDHGQLEYARSLLVVHNLAHQGRGPSSEVGMLDLPDAYFPLLRWAGAAWRAAQPPQSTPVA